LNDKKEFLKEFSIKHKNKNELFKILIKGNINILNNKINFKNIQINQDYNASKEDLNYFKQAFENILFDNDFSDIFNYKKIKEFILEIS
jgi:exonuclease III